MINNSSGKTHALGLAAAVALGIFALVPIKANAVSGTITFNGSISANTCKVSGEGIGPDFTITLPDAPTSALAGVGTFAFRRSFSLQVTGCGTSGTPSSAAAYWEPGAGVSTDGNLQNLITDATGSQGVELQLLNGSGGSSTNLSPIKLGQGDPANPSDPGGQNSGTFPINSTGAASLTYWVEYYQAEPTLRAGLFNSKAQYSMFYR